MHATDAPKPAILVVIRGPRGCVAASNLLVRMGPERGQALRQAIDVLWEWLPPTGGPSDADTLARLRTVFADRALKDAMAAAPKRLRKVVEDIRAVLARQDTDRKIIDTIWNETAVDRPWLIQALGMPENRMTITVRQPKTKVRETPA
jgi:hypothetical protein